jgi:glutathione synthase
MARDILFVCDPPERFDPRADSTFVMVTEALRRGHRPFAALLSGLGLRSAQAWADAAPLTLAGDTIVRGVAEPRALDDFACVLMRKDPPVDAGYLAATWMLDHTSTPVVNGPRGLRELNEKLAITRFSDLVPRTFVTRDAAEVRRALAELGGRAIAKPVYGFGGREVLLLRDGDPNLSSLIELAIGEGTRWSVIQEYLPAAAQGDKRILLVDGAPIGAVLRVPAVGELRNNFHAGGSPAKGDLDDRDRAICSRLAPMLRELDQFFVGIDVIGGRLTEINVTSPTGMQECNRLYGLAGDQTTQARFWTALESKLGDRQRS